MALLVPPPIVAGLVAAGMWLLAAAWPALVFDYPGRPLLVAVLAVPGVALFAGALLAFARARTTVNPMTPDKASALVTTGVFALSRNPIYVADALFLLAFAAWLGHPATLAGPVLFVWYIDRLQVVPEERALSALFGAAYADYCRRTRRWL